MPIYTIAIQVELDEPLGNAEAGRHLCGQIETAVEQLAGVTHVIAMSPQEGLHRRTTTELPADLRGG